MTHDYKRKHPHPFLRQRKEKDKHFYTALFIDDYYYDSTVDSDCYAKKVATEPAKLKRYEFDTDTNTTELKWLDRRDDEYPTLKVFHHLPSPITVEMWNNEGQPIFYAPLLNAGIDNMTIGNIIVSDIKNDGTFYLTFLNESDTPYDGKKFRLAIKTVPAFDMKDSAIRSNDVSSVASELNTLVESDPPGMAIIFKRQRLESYLDLLVELDEAYIHSQDESESIKYLVRKGGMDTVRWTTMYTNDINDLLNTIDATQYEIKFSWKDDKENI